MSQTPPVRLTRGPRQVRRLLDWLWASRPGAAVLARTMHWFDRAAFRLSGGRTSVAGLVTGLPVVMLTTTGARSGEPRSVPTLAIPDGAELWLIASNWGRRRYPAWYFNLRHNPRCRIAASGASAEYVAREVTDDAEYAWRWQRAVALYRDFARYRERAGPRRIPILVLRPAENS